MGRKISYLLIIIIFLWFPGYSWSMSDASKRFIEESLIERGLDKAQAQSMLYDPRIEVRPDIIIKNLFYSNPKGTEEEPSVMKIDPKLIEDGRVFMKQHTELLASVDRRFGVSPQIITAILIVESKLGTYPMRYNVVIAYANLAFMLDPNYLKELQQLYAEQYPQLHDKVVIARAQRRAKWALGELYHLALIANELKIDPLSIKGSFSGALGPAQFIPSTFRAYGIDGDEDGVRDPFNIKDVNVSIGNYLKQSGWSEGGSIERKRKAVWCYNRSQVYVNTIMMLYDELCRTDNPTNR